ncbi:MAG: PAS domain S-box protein, partial [Coleofasciculus sp. S288]|nr:PAS domain S-box protein [Coleofasciculus sp. S288]
MPNGFGIEVLILVGSAAQTCRIGTSWFLLVSLSLTFFGLAYYYLHRQIAKHQRLEANLSEERLRMALDAASMGIWNWNVLTNQITASSHCEQLFGLNPGTFGGTYEAFKACIYPEDLKPIIQAVNKSRLEQQDYHHEFRVVWPDNSIHWLEGKGRFFYDETRQAVRMLGTVMDISDRKRAEAELRESEAKFRQFAENIHEVFWMSNADVSEILYVSPAYEQIWGRSCENLYANPKSFLDAIYPDDKPEAIENVERHATGIFDTEYRIIRPDGSMRWIHDRGFPIRNEFGEIYRRAGIAQDITQRKHAEAILRQVNEDLERRVAERTAKLEQANEQLQRELLERERVERALRKSEERWQLAIRGSNDGIWDLNLKRDRCFYSARWGEMLGYEEHEISNSSHEWAMLVHPDDLERVIQARQAHLERKTPYYIAEYRMRCKDGSYKWILSRAQAVWDKAGNPVRMVGSHSDISDHKQAEETLRKQACIFENLYDAVVLTDLDGRIIDWNPAAERIFGYSKAEVLGKTPAILHRTEESSLLTGEVFQEMLKAGRWVGEINFVRKDGTEGVCETVVVPLYNEQGEAIATIGVNKDISDAYRQATQRKQAEAERAKLIAILEATPDVVGHASLDQKVHYLNSAGRKILGLDENENLAHLTIRDCHPQWAYKILRDEGIPTAIREGTWVGETAFLSHNGQEIPVSQLLIAHKSLDGSVNLLSTVARDITQQKQIAATLLEAERRWRSLLENVRLGVVGLDKNGKIEYTNPYFLELVGYTKAEVLNKDWFETFLPHHLRHREQNSFLELLEHEFYTHDRNVILTKSGEERVIAWNNT